MVVIHWEHGDIKDIFITDEEVMILYSILMVYINSGNYLPKGFKDLVKMVEEGKANAS